MKLSTSELIQKGINAFKCAEGSLKEQNIEQAELCFAAARTWANRAEYSIKYDCELGENDFEFADREMFERQVSTLRISDRDYSNLTPLQLDELADDQ